MKDEVAEVGIIIGRFQSPYLHDGHKELIDHVTEKHPRVFVFIGQAQVKATTENTLDFSTRRAMVEEKYPNVEVHRIDDVGDDKIWSHNLDRMVDLMVGPTHKVVLYGSRESFVKSYSGKYNTEVLKPSKYISASEIRKNIGVKSKKTQDFRYGAIWTAQNRYPSVFTTVDIIVYNRFEVNLFDRNKDQVLLGRKPTDKLWRFPGGFSETTNQSFEDDALRELQEETNIIGVNPEYIGSTLVDDARYRGEKDKIKTMLFVVTKYDDSNLQAGDDLSDAMWFDWKDIRPSMLVPNHRILWQMFNEKYINPKTPSNNFLTSEDESL